jgi:NET1-associated nuclear protein 1 (U3 small nucleolar RNA-associated protein 17)
MRMADNSVMVLSTSDLVPQTNISGVSAARGLGRRLRATISPNEPDQLLLATPSDLFPNPKSSFNPSATMLQTFDLRTSHQVSRQALARNMTTAVNVDPKGQRIGDPDVVQLQVSHDGLWLASVDEWTPPETDSEPLDRHVNQSRSLSRTETCLRFWSWKEESKTWEMTTRIDGPRSAGHYSVLGLAVNPVRAEYASAGTDGYVRIWTPMLRLRNGLSIKNLAGEPLYTWTCLYELQPDPLSPSQSTSRAESAALAYSEDGSAIAISFMFAGRSRILHFVDSRTGFLRDRDSQAHLCPQGDVEMAFSGTRLLFLSDTFFVWDVVHFMAISSPIVLKKPFTRNNGRFLAANAFNGTFALALNPTDFKTPAVVVIFDAKQPGQVLHHAKIHGHVKALLPSIKGPGYVVVDGEARVIQIKPSDAARESLKLSSGSKDEAPKGLNDIFGGSKNDVGIGAPAGGARPWLSNAEGAALVSDGQPRSLEDILEQQAFSTVPPVSELFEKVAGLFRKAH